MTKEEFDELFAAGKLCIYAGDMTQWASINDYAYLQLGIKKSPSYLSHSCSRFPFVFVNGKIIDASIERNGRWQISFSNFLEITHEAEEEEILYVSLNEVL